MDLVYEDLLAFGLYYLPSLVASLLTALFLLAAAVWARRRRLKPAYASLLLCSTPVPLVWFLMYFLTTSDLTSTLIALGSESSGLAERAYAGPFKRQVATLDAAVRLAVNKHQEPNVRFYASCLIADMLSTNDEKVVRRVLDRVDCAPIVDTQFFGGNSLTDGLYVPGHGQVHLPVRDIILQRLQRLRSPAR